MRYKLTNNLAPQEVECLGQRRNTKKEIEQWCQDAIETRGLDWRVGFTIKLRDSRKIYTWRWVKTGKEVKI